MQNSATYVGKYLRGKKGTWGKPSQAVYVSRLTSRRAGFANTIHSYEPITSGTHFCAVRYALSRVSGEKLTMALYVLHCVPAEGVMAVVHCAHFVPVAGLWQLFRGGLRMGGVK
jgi:hypothetical protein